MKITRLVTSIVLLTATLLRVSGQPTKEAAPPSSGDALQARMQTVLQTALGMGSQNASAALGYLETETRKLIKEYPQRPEPYELLVSAASFSDADKSRALAQEISESKMASVESSNSAAGLLKNLELIGKPLALKFTALDGRPVDLETLKGRVVLIDFWATWCPPCIGMLPHLKSTYEQLKPRGFEIVGISYDDDKGALATFLKREQVAWPQYFDSKGRENALAERFNVHTLPTMWLVDKKGSLRYLNAGSDLPAKLSKLLDE